MGSSQHAGTVHFLRDRLLNTYNRDPASLNLGQTCSAMASYLRFPRDIAALSNVRKDPTYMDWVPFKAPTRSACDLPGFSPSMPYLQPQPDIDIQTHVPTSVPKGEPLRLGCTFTSPYLYDHHCAPLVGPIVKALISFDRASQEHSR